MARRRAVSSRAQPSGQQQAGQQPSGQQSSSQTPSGQTPSGHAAKRTAASGQQQSGQQQNGQQQNGQQQNGQTPSGQQPSGKNPDGRPGAAAPSQPACRRRPAGSPGAEARRRRRRRRRADEPPAVTAARERFEAAATRLDEVKDEPERSECSPAAARNRARAAAMFCRGAQGRHHLDDGAAPRGQPAAVRPRDADRTRALLDELAKMQQAAQLGRRGAKQAACQDPLDQPIEMLGRAQAARLTRPRRRSRRPTSTVRAGAGRAAAPGRGPHAPPSELPEQGFQQPAGAAQKAMQGAQDSLKSGDSREGATREQEAAEMEQAAQQMSGASNKYEQPCRRRCSSA
jgi:hypothetical protein